MEQTKWLHLWDELLPSRLLHNHNGMTYNPHKKSLVHPIRSLLHKESPFDKPAFSRFYQLSAPHPKILEGWTEDAIQIFDILFKCSWPKSSTHALEKCFENPDFLFCQSFQNLRLGGINYFNHESWFTILVATLLVGRHASYADSVQDGRTSAKRFRKSCVRPVENIS